MESFKREGGIQQEFYDQATRNVEYTNFDKTGSQFIYVEQSAIIVLQF